MTEAPPRPPPHGPKASGLPTGKYDIFVIPEHSAGGGFLYLPSLKPNINSFVAGFFTAMLCVAIWNALLPALSSALASLSSGVGLLIAVLAVTVAFSFGRTLTDGASGYGFGAGQMPNFNYGWRGPGGADASAGGSSASSGWEKAREETRRREQERKRAEEVKAAAEAATKKKEEAEKAGRAAAEKERWDQARAREKDVREKEARERIAKERAAREAAKGAPGGTKYQKPTAQSAADSGDQYNNGRYKHPFASSASSASGRSESSYAPSMSTARTTPPPQPAKDRGPYTTTDANKVIIHGVFLYTAAFQKPVRMLVRGQGGVTDGLILRVTTEGLFIDDDVRNIPQREWDVKAWGIKQIEVGRLDGISVCRVIMRDAEGKRFLFVLPAEQSWKVDVGLERLRKGSQVRSMGMTTIKEPDVKAILSGLGW